MVCGCVFQWLVNGEWLSLSEWCVAVSWGTGIVIVVGVGRGSTLGLPKYEAGRRADGQLSSVKYIRRD